MAGMFQSSKMASGMLRRQISSAVFGLVGAKLEFLQNPARDLAHDAAIVHDQALLHDAFLFSGSTAHCARAG
jgi:hypothetical protein